MKKAFHFIIVLILLGGFVVSCSSNRGFISSVTRDDIQQMVKFEMYNFGYVKDGSYVIKDDSVTDVAKSLFEKALANDKTLSVTGTIVISDSLVNKEIQNEIKWCDYLAFSLFYPISIKDIEIPPTIDSILCSRNERFGLIIYNGGYTCPDGIYNPVSGSFGTNKEGYITSSILIVDSKNKSFAYVAHTDRNSDPMKAETHQKQLDKLLKNYKK